MVELGSNQMLAPDFKGRKIKFMNIETIRCQALSLPAKERAELAEQLLSSQDTLSEDEIEQLWFQEAVRRTAELDQGLAQRISAEDVHKEAQALLK